MRREPRFEPAPIYFIQVSGPFRAAHCAKAARFGSLPHLVVCCKSRSFAGIIAIMLRTLNRTLLAPLVVAGCLLTADAAAGPTILDWDEHSARTQLADTVFYNNETPVLNVRNVGGDAVLVEGDEIEDIFDEANPPSSIVVTIAPPSGETITVTGVSGPSWSEDPSSGEWTATMSMPSEGQENTAEFDVELDSGGLSDDGNHFKIKKMGDNPL